LDAHDIGKPTAAPKVATAKKRLTRFIDGRPPDGVDCSSNQTTHVQQRCTLFRSTRRLTSQSSTEHVGTADVSSMPARTSKIVSNTAGGPALRGRRREIQRKEAVSATRCETPQHEEASLLFDEKKVGLQEKNYQAELHSRS
jgi:hypothetical protein